ncbi:MAG: toll/interleukin-1 receptor domain-containing protein [Acidobacteriota bacterium]
MSDPTVFISYSHRDEAWKDRLLPQLLALEQAGVGMRVWQDRKIDGGDKWYPEILEAMANSAAAVLLISPDFLASKFCIQDEVPALLKRQETQGMLLVPVLLRPCVWQAHRWLKDRQMLPRNGECVAIDFAGDMADAVFTTVAEQVLSHLQQIADNTPTAVVIPVAVHQLVAQPVAQADQSIVAPPPEIP